MKREEYLRELESAGLALKARTHELAEAVNPINQLRSEVARDWKWWLPGASVAGFAVARVLRSGGTRAIRGKSAERPAGGAAFWVPTLLKLAPAAIAQLLPLLLSLRSGGKR